MGRRGGPGRYQSFGREPAEHSRLEFMVEAVKRLDATARFPLGAEPTPTPHDTSPGFRRFLEHENGRAEAFISGCEARAVECLRALGVPPERLADPEDAEAARAVTFLALGERLTLLRVSEAPPAGAVLSDIPAHLRVIAAAVYEYGGRQQAADWLNEDVRPGQRGLLTRDHTRRAEKAYRTHLHRLRPGHREAQALAFFLHMNDFRVIRYILESARRRPEYVGLRGARLVAAIEDRDGLAVTFDKTVDILGDRGELLDVGPPALALVAELRAAVA